MRLTDLIGWLKFRKAAFVSTREELEAAMRREPPRIVVDGDEALRAYAARVVVEGVATEVAGPAKHPATTPAYMTIPTVGRIRDGYRKPRKPKQAKPWMRLRGGMDTVLVAAIGIAAALLMEWLSFPDEDPRIIRVAHHAGRAPPPPPAHVADWAVMIAIPLLGLVAVAALGWVLWQGLGLGRKPQTGWRIEHRVPGRLIMARVRRRIV